MCPVLAGCWRTGARRRPVATNCRRLLTAAGLESGDFLCDSVGFPSCWFSMWIKICGIKTIEDAAGVARAGADAIGLNFYPRSRRSVRPQDARLIADECREQLEVVGVFVNDAPAEVARIVDEVGLTAVQFHGDETPEDLVQFQGLCPEVPVIRAFRIGGDSRSLSDLLSDYDQLSPPMAAALADAWHADEYGGTGERVAAELLDGHRELVPRLILAGGLTPANVAQAVRQLRPWGVDTASGVESAPGVKSQQLVQEFVAGCRAATPDEPKAFVNVSAPRR